MSFAFFVVVSKGRVADVCCTGKGFSTSLFPRVNWEKLEVRKPNRPVVKLLATGVGDGGSLSHCSFVNRDLEGVSAETRVLSSDLAKKEDATWFSLLRVNQEEEVLDVSSGLRGRGEVTGLSLGCVICEGLEDPRPPVLLSEALVTREGLRGPGELRQLSL